jgi:hypothetical protein
VLTATAKYDDSEATPTFHVATVRGAKEEPILPQSAFIVLHFSMPIEWAITIFSQTRGDYMINPVANLETLRKQFQAQYKGHRSQIISLTCRSFQAALEIRKSSKRRKAFFMLANIPSKGRDRLNIVTEVLVYAMSGDESEKKRKLAWKRSRAIQYLHESGVAVRKLEREIVRRGGIEALVREASKVKPRRTASVHDSASHASKKPIKNAPSAGGGETPTKASRSNDQLSLVSLKIKLSDLDGIRDLREGEQAKLIVTRLAASSPIAEVNRVRRVE